MSCSLKFHLFGVVLLALALDDVLSCTSRSGLSSEILTTTPPINDRHYSCGFCGEPMNMILVFNNGLKEPFFNFNVTVSNKPRRELIYFLQWAGDEDPRARFTSTYWGQFGHMVNSINNMAANPEESTYWRILEHTTGNGLDLGVSSYIPIDQEILQFNFTTYGDH